MRSLNHAYFQLIQSKNFSKIKQKFANLIFTQMIITIITSRAFFVVVENPNIMHVLVPKTKV